MPHGDVMDAEEAQRVVARLMHSLRSVLESHSPNQCPVQDAADFPEYAALYWDLSRLRDFAFAVSQGDLSRKLVMRGFLPGALKTLQANLAHLTWQTRMIASGDLSQRVEFMGEFSKAFNTMVSTLEDNRRQLLRKEEDLKRANELLRQEVQARAAAQEKLQASKQRYRTLAMRDSLSGLYNRRYFFLVGKRELVRSLRTRSPLSFFIFDLDHFKAVNDTHGHAAGDAVLRAIGRLTVETLRAVDLCGRYGGEEFVALLPDCPRQNAVEVAQRLRQAIAAHPFEHEGRAMSLTASFGVATLEFGPDRSAQEPTRLDTLAAFADQALYRAKSLGRNRVESV